MPAPPRLWHTGGAALRTLGTLQGGARGLPSLEEAVTVLAGSSARLEHARALVDHGQLLRRCSTAAAATEQLRTGIDLAHRCEATALVESAATQLRLGGARPRRIALSGRESLTPGERRVTDLAAQGMSAQQLAANPSADCSVTPIASTQPRAR